MNSSGVNWLPALITAIGGLLGGALLLWRLKLQAPKEGPAPDDAGARRDLETRRDFAIEQLRASSPEAEGPEARRQRHALELAAARDWMELDRLASRRAQGARQGRTAPAAASGSTLRGFLWGVGSVSAVGLVVFLALRTAEPKAPQAEVPADDLMARLAAEVERQPDNLEARLALARHALEHNDLMAVFNATRFVLERQPEEPRALTYNAVVRMAMGQSQMAEEMLERALRVRPDLEDAYVYLMLVHTETGNPGGADRALTRAKQALPGEADNLTSMLARMRSEAAARGPAPATAAAENPHAALDATTAASATPAPLPRADDGAISGQLELAPGAPTASGGVVFVVLRPAGQRSGPPLAVKKLPAGAFPMPFAVGSADSMTGAALPARVLVEARLDADGDAATRSADELTASLDGVALGTRDVHLALSRGR